MYVSDGALWQGLHGDSVGVVVFDFGGTLCERCPVFRPGHCYLFFHFEDGLTLQVEKKTATIPRRQTIFIQRADSNIKTWEGSRFGYKSQGTKKALKTGGFTSTLLY